MRGRATQSSLLGGAWSSQGYMGQAINAIDGNQNTNYQLGSCTHTGFDFRPWWRVDLLRKYKVSSITVTTRDGAPERLKGAEVLIGNSLSNNGNNNDRCGIIAAIATGTTHTFLCNGMEGRYVNVVVRSRKEYLTLCEVQVFADQEPEEMANKGIY
ncbi:fucolectin-4-like [Lissotriton helveticus]